MENVCIVIYDMIQLESDRRKFQQERIPCGTKKLNSVPQPWVEVLRLPRQVEKLPVDVLITD